MSISFLFFLFFFFRRINKVYPTQHEPNSPIIIPVGVDDIYDWFDGSIPTIIHPQHSETGRIESVTPQETTKTASTTDRSAEKHQRKAGRKPGKLSSSSLAIKSRQRRQRKKENVEEYQKMLEKERERRKRYPKKSNRSTESLEILNRSKSNWSKKKLDYLRLPGNEQLLLEYKKHRNELNSKSKKARQQKAKLQSTS